MSKEQVVVIGGGLAGLCFAIDAKMNGIEVLVIEPKTYPFHRVCGEYVSNEVKMHLTYLGAQRILDKSVQIKKIELTSLKGNSLVADLPLGGFGISRSTFDFELYTLALQKGVRFLTDKVIGISSTANKCIITTKNKEIKASLVVAAHGKRSLIDKELNRSFFHKKTPWMGIKAHFLSTNFSSSKVQLHNFNGGYCGISEVENKIINFCALINTDVFKKHNSINAFVEAEMKKNPFIASFFENSSMLFEDFLAISQVSFQSKPKHQQRVLFIGDAAGLIHPLCGNGMAMAIHAAKIATNEVVAFFQHNNSERLISAYSAKWNGTFSKRMRVGSALQELLIRPKWTNFAMKVCTKSPTLLRTLIKLTHGEKDV